MYLTNIVWNLAGLSLPLMVAAVTIPQLIERLGYERFGLLALGWGLIGYAGVLDLGIGRALTQMVAKLQGKGEVATVAEILDTATRITLVSGTIGGGLIVLFALIVNPNWISIRETPENEIKLAMLLMALALPAQAMSATYKGLNEAYQNFKGINILRIGLGVITFGGPYFLSQFTHNLAALVATLVVSRIAALIIYRNLAHSCILGVGLRGGKYSKTIAKDLFSFGGWVTVSSVVSPFLVQADRFVIAAVISASAVTVYVIPYEIVVQSLILVGAISSVAFPVLGSMMEKGAMVWRPYFYRWLSRVAVLMAFVCVLLAFTLPYILNAWIHDYLNPSSIAVGQILCIGVFANALGTMFYALIHANGRADWTAKAHLVELPLFITALLIFVPNYGVIAAAWVWVGRTTIDLLILARLGAKL